MFQKRGPGDGPEAKGSDREAEGEMRRGNAVLWKLWKAKSKLPTASTALGNRYRDSHISTAPTSVGKWKTETRFPTFPLSDLLFYV